MLEFKRGRKKTNTPKKIQPRLSISVNKYTKNKLRIALNEIGIKGWVELWEFILNNKEKLKDIKRLDNK